MQPVTVRASNSSMMMWVGAIIIVFGAMTALYGLAVLLQGSMLQAAVFGLLGVLMVVAGAVVIGFGLRTCARADAHGISWGSGLGSRTSVPWPQVARVLVPGARDPGDSVALQLRDGRIVPITPLRKTRGADSSTRLSPWYLRAGATLQSAHQQWLGLQRRHH